jgi:hypothetical protein
VKIDGQLVAFLLHAPKGDLVHNLATGVRRDYQGQGLTGLMYEQIFKDLPGKGFKRAKLEVITENVKGIRAYEKAGLKIGRKLLAWKGTPTGLPKAEGEHTITQVNFRDELKTLEPYPLAFEQDWPVVLRRQEMLEQHELRLNGTLAAYAIWNPWQMNMVQLGGTDSSAIAILLRQMKLEGENFGMINVDEKKAGVNELFKNLGLVNYLSQYEMEKAL